MTRQVEKEWELQGHLVDWRRSSHQIGKFTLLTAEHIATTYFPKVPSTIRDAYRAQSIMWWVLGTLPGRSFAIYNTPHNTPQPFELRRSSHTADKTHRSFVVQLTVGDFFHQYASAVKIYLLQEFGDQNYGGYTQLLQDLEKRTRHAPLQMELVPGRNGFEIVQMVTRDYSTKR